MSPNLKAYSIVTLCKNTFSPSFGKSLLPVVTHARGTHSSTQSSIDPSHVSHHGKLASEWWDEYGFMKALHSMNSIRVPLIRDGLIKSGLTDKSKVNSPRPLEGVRIVDVGCGGGILSEPLARLGAEVIGIDASAELIEIAQEHTKTDSSLTTLSYKNTTAEQHALEAPEYYHAVVSSEVVEHVADKNFFLEECIKLLKPSGSIFLTTLNRTTLSWLGIIASEQIMRLIPQGTHEWEKFIPPHELQMILEKQCCSTKLIHGMCYNPLTDDWSWSKNTSINYALHAVKHTK